MNQSCAISITKHGFRAKLDNFTMNVGEKVDN
jgi:hypothetical protein